MHDLIKKLEAAPGPSLALECEIAEAFLPSEWFGSKVESWFGHGTGIYGCNTADGMRHLDCQRAGKFTTSVDAAMTLVPDGLDFVVRSLRGHAEARVGGAKDDYIIKGGHHVTPAMALCIAALKAHEYVAERGLSAKSTIN